MLRAMALLAAPGQSVQETSTAVGFDSLSAFTRAFTQFCGETPSTYRKGLAEQGFDRAAMTQAAVVCTRDPDRWTTVADTGPRRS